MLRRAGLYALLAVLLPIALAYQAMHAYGSVRSLLDWQKVPGRPFDLEAYSPVVLSVDPEAREAGLREGDRVAAIGGVPFSGGAVLDVALAGERAGDILALTLDDGRTVSIRLVPRRAVPPNLADWAQTIVLQALIPALCLFVGFWVAGIRPRDPLAWLLLALLLSFSLIITGGGTSARGGLLRDLEILYEGLFGATWPIWMLLFGEYFPERLPLDRRYPWVKWILIVPYGVLTAAQVCLAVAAGRSFAPAMPLARLMAPLERPQMILGMLCISGFFMALGVRTGTSTAPDVRRRIKLLYAGAIAGLTPMFLVALTALVRGTTLLEGVPAWMAITALTMMSIFPVALAYVIVVHRALDVRVVIRQGIRYAFARRGVQVLRAVMIFGILLAISAAASRPHTRQVDILRILGQGGMAIVAIGWGGEWLIRFTDRRFFREALDVERILGGVSDQVRTMVETGPLLDTVARALSSSLHVSRVAFLLDDGDGYAPAYALGFPDAPTVRFAKDSATVLRLARDGEPLKVYLDDPASWLRQEPAAGDAERAALRSLGTELVLPLAVQERMPGFISLGAKRSEEPYSGTDLRLLRSVGTQAALALENSRLAAAVAAEAAQRERMNREVEIAREVQERLFPQSLPEVAGLDYSGRCRPALGVGGDYFDFVRLPEGRLGVAIADVSGKGIGAALLMASLQASLRGQLLHAGGTARMIDNVNRLVYEATPDNRYATFFYGQYDPASRLFSFVNAGHCPPILLRGNPPAGAAGSVVRLEPTGTVVGMFEDSVYREGTVTLGPGDLLVAYTDGISEARNQGGEEWGEDRLVAAAGRCRGLAAGETIDRILQEADAFAVGAPQHDDMTLVVLRAV